MEHVLFYNSRNILLTGNLYPAGNALIILCHGLASDQISKGRSSEPVKTFNQTGFSALTFDFSGCGGSGDDSITIDKETDDLNAAISFVKSRGCRKIGLYGHSMGGLICLKGFSPEIGAMSVSGAMTGPVKYDLKDFYSEEQLRELDRSGFLTEIKTGGTREKVIIEKSVFTDSEKIDQKELFGKISIPVLMVHGDGDEEEKRMTVNSKKALKYLPAGSKLEIIKGAGHSFTGYYDVLAGLVGNWFVEHLK